MATTKNRLYDRVQKANGDEDRDGDWLRFDGSDRIAAVSDEPHHNDNPFEDLDDKFVDMWCRGPGWMLRVSGRIQERLRMMRGHVYGCINASASAVALIREVRLPVALGTHFIFFFPYTRLPKR